MLNKLNRFMRKWGIILVTAFSAAIFIPKLENKYQGTEISIQEYQQVKLMESDINYDKSGFYPLLHVEDAALIPVIKAAMKDGKITKNEFDNIGAIHKENREKFIKESALGELKNL